MWGFIDDRKKGLRLEGVMGLWLQLWRIRLRVGTSMLPRIPKSPPTECRKTPAPYSTMNHRVQEFWRLRCA